MLFVFDHFEPKKFYLRKLLKKRTSYALKFILLQKGQQYMYGFFDISIVPLESFVFYRETKPILFTVNQIVTKKKSKTYRMAINYKIIRLDILK